MLDVVEDLSYVFSDNKPNLWDAEEIEKRREAYLADLVRVRDAFVYARQDILLDELERDSVPILVEEPARIAASA